MSTGADAGPGVLGRALRLAWPVALVVLGASVLATAWHRWPVSLLFVATAAVPLLLLRAALRAGLSRWFATSMLLLLVVMGAYLATSGADLSLEETVRDVVPRLLTAPQPYAVQADLLVGPLLLTAFVSILVGLRADSRLRVEPVVGGAVLYVAGVLLTAGAADPWGLVAALMLLLALLGWVFFDEHAEPVRGRLSMAGPLSVVGVGAVAALATLPVSQAFEPRGLVEPPVYEVVASNPLTQLGAWANNPDEELLRVRGEKVPLRLVVLDEYDGTQWTSNTTFRALRSDGRTGLTAGSYVTAATLQVEFADLGGSWLPSPGTPTTLGLPDALVDPDTGTLYSTDDTAGLSYEVTGAFDDPPPRALERARLSTEAMSGLTDLPPLPPSLAEYARRVTADTATPYEQASAIEAQIREQYELSPSAISGSALWRIEEFLLGGRGAAGGRVGTSEQFATSFAVLARYTGLPTRVVVGFRPGEEQDDGSRVVRGEDAFAWAEVYFEDLGWVPFSPTPDDDTFDRPRPVKAEQPDLPEPADTGAPPTAAPTTAAADEDADPVAQAPSRGGGGTAAPEPALVAASAGAAFLLVLLGLRAGRRLRHRRQGAAGAWAEVVDALRLSGLRPSPHDPADLVAARADARLGIDAAVPVAARAEHATFGPERLDAGGVRRQVRTVRRAARRSTPLWRRWWWWLDPRVLGR